MIFQVLKKLTGAHKAFSSHNKLSLASLCAAAERDFMICGAVNS
jgi:hypothetical protein